MSNRLADTYSVFIGHIHPDTKKAELLSVFENVGQVVDLFIMDSQESQFSYGFVRYPDAASALRAVSELNRWVIRGCELVVDIAKDTARKIKQDKVLDCGMAGRPSIKHKKEMKPGMMASKASDFIQDTVYLSRVKETCTAINLQTGDREQGQVNMNRLLEDMSRSSVSRGSTVWSDLQQPQSSFKDISNTIMTRCSKAGKEGRFFGERKSQEFMSALITIMEEIQMYVSSNMSCSTSLNHERVSVPDGGLNVLASQATIKCHLCEDRCLCGEERPDKQNTIMRQKDLTVVSSDQQTSSHTPTLLKSDDCEGNCSTGPPDKLPCTYKSLETVSKEQATSVWLGKQSSVLNRQDLNNSKQDLMFQDPAVLALQTSPIIPSSVNCEPSADTAHLLELLGIKPTLARSDSRGSSISEDSTGVNDSGVETEYIDMTPVKVNQDCRTPEQRSALNDPVLQDYLHRVRGRGRGVSMTTGAKAILLPRGRGESLSALLSAPGHG